MKKRKQKAKKQLKKANIKAASVFLLNGWPYFLRKYQIK